MLRLGALALIVCLHICFAYSVKNTAKLKAKFSSSRSFNTTAIHSFPSWFQSPSTALALLTINPVIESLDNSSLPSGRPHFIANLAPIDILPGVRLLQSANIEVIRLNSLTLLLKMNQKGVRNVFQGSKLMVSILSTLPSVDIESETILHYHRRDSYSTGYTLHNDAELTVTFRLPSFFPLSVQKMERMGSNIIQRKLMRDMESYNDNIIALYEQQLALRQEEGKLDDSGDRIACLHCFRTIPILFRWNKEK